MNSSDPTVEEYTLGINGEEQLMLSTALELWCNYIETGNITINKKRYLECGLPVEKLPRLSTQQQNKVKKLLTLRDEILSC